MRSTSTTESQISARFGKPTAIHLKDTVAHKYNTPLICTLLLCQVVFLLCRALCGSSKHFSAMPSRFPAMPRIFLLF